MIEILEKGLRSAPSPQESDRIARCRLMLLKFGVAGNDPRWSSALMEQLVADTMAMPGGSITDLFTALSSVLGDNTGDLSTPLANFIKDLVIACFTRYRTHYLSVDWSRFVRETPFKPTTAQCYFLLHAIPPQYVPPELSRGIATGLASTPYREEAVSLLAVPA